MGPEKIRKKGRTLFCFEVEDMVTNVFCGMISICFEVADMIINHNFKKNHFKCGFGNTKYFEVADMILKKSFFQFFLVFLLVPVTFYTKNKE